MCSSKFKLAYVKDGQIHLQLCDSNSIDVEEDSTELIESETTNDAESAVTGRNLITGQTVYLNDYLSRLRKRIIRANDCRKHQAGHDKTSSGKRLVARILEIKTPDVKLDIIEHGAETQRDNSDVLRQNESVNIEAVKHHPNIVRGNTKINNRKKIEVLNASLQGKHLSLARFNYFTLMEFFCLCMYFVVIVQWMRIMEFTPSWKPKMFTI